ncbi:MAG: hypothetical protein Q9226_000464 [Calogaya cf. arnoldii]
MAGVPSRFSFFMGRLNVSQSTLIILAILPLIVLVTFIYRYVRARCQFPGPPVKNFWTGNLDQTMADNVHEKWNGLFSRVIYIGDPGMITTITTSNWPKSAAQYEGFKPLSGDALFVQTNHEKWHIQRKRLAPAFQPQIIEAQYGCFAKHLTRCVEYLDTAARDKRFVDFASLHVLLSLDFIGDIAYGVDFRALTPGTVSRIPQLLHIVLPELMKCGLFPLRAKFPILKQTREMHSAIAEMRLMAKKAVENARNNPDRSYENRKKSSNKIFEILAMQKESNGNYSFSSTELVDNYGKLDDLILDHLLIQMYRWTVAFLVAGADPTAHTMSFLLYEAVRPLHPSQGVLNCEGSPKFQFRHPEIMTRLRAEVDASMPDPDSIACIDQTKLPYLNMVLKETLRYHSTGFGTFRTCPVDTTVCGTTLPANTTLCLWNPGGQHLRFLHA